MDAHLADPGEAGDAPGGLALEVIAHGALGDSQGQSDRNNAIAVDIDRPHHSQVDQVATELGVDDTP